MATSGTVRLGRTCSDIITAAFRITGRLALGETLSGAEYQEGRDCLNSLISSWQNERLGLWLLHRVTLFLTPGKSSYSIGPDGDACALSWSETTLAEDRSAGVTLFAVSSQQEIADDDSIALAQSVSAAGNLTLNGRLVTPGVASGTATLSRAQYVQLFSTGDETGVTFTIHGTGIGGGIQSESLSGPGAGSGSSVITESLYETVTRVYANGACAGSVSVGHCDKYIGIELDSGSFDWLPADGGTDTLLRCSIYESLSGDASSGNRVYGYSVKVHRPNQVIRAVYVDENDLETTIKIISDDQFDAISDKSLESRPTQAWYEQTLDNGTLHLWPVPDTADTQVVLTVRYPLEIFVDLTDAAEFPDTWIAALEYGLARELCYRYGLIGTSIGSEIAARAVEEKMRAVRGDRDGRPRRFRPSPTAYGRY